MGASQGAPAVIRIVIADDHRMVRQALRRVLELRGFDVVGEADDGLSVADLVATTKPDVLILDMALPGLHGLDVLQRVVDKCPRTRVLVLSADGREEFVVGAVKGGAWGYVLKGGDLAELVSAVEALGHGDRFLSSAISDHLVQAVTDPARTTPVDSYQSLTAREREVFMLIAMGLSNTEIGNRLFVSPRTAETHRANIMRKLKLRSQTDAVLLAVRRGLVPAA